MKTLTHLISQLTCACKEAKDFAHQSCVCECDTLVPLYKDLADHELAQAKEIVKYIDHYIDKADDKTYALFHEAYEYAKEMLADTEREIRKLYEG